MENKLTYALYARKSSEGDDRQVLSIESQLNEVKALAARENIKITKFYQEARSAKEPGRPIFNQMIEDIKKGEIDAIICWKIDRLGRNPVDDGIIKWLLQTSKIKRIRTIEKEYLPGDNVLILSVEQGVANQFILDLRENTKRGLRTKVSRGWLPGRAPLGYYNNKFKEKGKKDILPDETNFNILKRCWLEILEKKTAIQPLYTKAINKWGLRTFKGTIPAKSRFYDVFSNPFYYGKFRYHGEIHEGKHIPMITEEQFDEAQYIIGNRKKPQPKRHTFAYTGTTCCGECGGMITAENKTKKQKNGNIHHYTYYRCTKNKGVPCSQKCIRVEKFEKQISKEIKKIEINKEFHEWAMGIIEKEHSTETAITSAITAQHKKEYTLCSTKLSNLIDMRASNEINSEEFSTRRDFLIKEKKRLEKLIQQVENSKDSCLEKSDKLFTFAEKVNDKFLNGDLEKRREIFVNLGENFILKDNILTLELTPPLSAVLTINKEIEKAQKPLEPHKTIVTKEFLREIYTRNPVVGAYRESNPNRRNHNPEF